MIIKLKEWCEGIIVAIVISIIMEMIIPESKNKKYIKVVIGIYIVFVTLNPILKLIKYDINFDNIIDMNTVETSEITDNNIKQVYILGIEQNIKNDITNLGYDVKNVSIEVDSDYENINYIDVKISGKKISNEINLVEPIVIENEKSKINNDYNEEITNFLKENYFVDEENINIIQE